MKGLLSKKIPLIVGAAVLLVGLFIFNTGFKKIDFNTEVKPIFNKKCITCHGGVKRKAGFSLLFRSDALANTESGKPALVPGHPEKSEMIRRLTLSDPEERRAIPRLHVDEGGPRARRADAAHDATQPRRRRGRGALAAGPARA